MKRRQRNRGRLLLDAIYNSNDPAVQDFITDVMIEEMDKAQQRAQMRVAVRFKHMLSPRMQAILAAQCPAEPVAATA